MPLRVLEARIPSAASHRLERVVQEHPVIDHWSEPVEGGERSLVRILVRADRAEPLLDALEQSFSSEDELRIVLLPVEAALPRPEEPDEEEPGEEDEDGESASGVGRVSREELHTQLSAAAQTTPVYLLLTALSAVVCAFGLLKGDIAVVIGAMVIAPLLGPLTALSLATTLADGPLAWRAGRSGAAGLLVAGGLAVLIGLLAPVDPALPEIASRTSVDLADVGLALAAGSAGTLAFTSGAAEAVIGVMVAVALVPPLVAGGLLAGAGYAAGAAGALLLTATNLIGLNLAGVVTFLAQGVRPNTWWEAEQARRSTAWALAVWSLLLASLVAAIALDVT